MIVCIAEKPSVAAEIAKVLGAKTKRDGYHEGNGYQVTWTFGHLCQLKSPDAYYSSWKKWDMNTLPMIPSRFEIDLIPDAGIKKQFKIIKELFKKADTIINCGDAAQEGELIQRWVMELAGVKCPVKRLWISSLTEESIRQGFRELRDQREFDNLYKAGQARSEGDWLLGINCTRLYTLKYGGQQQVLSIGRVQTPTLAMIVSRDQEIDHFHPVPYWLLTTKYRDTVFSCTAGRFDNEARGRELLEASKRSILAIKDIQQKRGSEQPPQLYDLTALQVDCNRKYGFSAETTLNNIQSLYEKKLTTYPRVDTKFLTDDIFTKCPGIIKGLASISDAARGLVGRQLPKSKRVFDNSKVTDHHAIIPTGETVNLSSINSYERKVYDLVLQRFCAVFYPNCEYAQTTVLANAGGVDFKATGRTILNEGWRIIYNNVRASEQEEDIESDENTVLPAFRVGECGQHAPSLVQKMTTPPKRYTEASLLQAMETAGKFVDDEVLREAMKENGIGRPSSRAAIIETLLKRKYIRREKKALISNPAGRDLISIIAEPMLKSPELTGQWEKKLRDIEHGTFTLDGFMTELQDQLVYIIKGVKGDTTGHRIAPANTATSTAPKKGATYKGGSNKTIKKGKGPVLVYSSQPVKEGDKCPICGKGTVRKSQYGFFCTEYKTSGCRLTYKG